MQRRRNRAAAGLALLAPALALGGGCGLLLDTEESALTAGDGGAADAGRADAGTSDSGRVDAGEAREDAGRPDAGPEGACRGPEDCPPVPPCAGEVRCVASECVVGPPPCDDGLACTRDDCTDVGGVATCASVDACPEGAACSARTGTCVTEAECTTDPECDDGAACNGVERCEAGVCRPGSRPDLALVCGECGRCAPGAMGVDDAGCVPNADACDDGASCTEDRCVRSPGGRLGCTYVRDSSGCSDGIACTGDFCDPASEFAVEGTGCAHPPRDSLCPGDAFDCTAEICDPERGGCVTEFDDGACDDGAACTSDECDPGAEGADGASGCVNRPRHSDCRDDGFTCTTDELCAPRSPFADALGCVHVPDDSVCEALPGPGVVTCGELVCAPGHGVGESGCAPRVRPSICLLSGGAWCDGDLLCVPPPSVVCEGDADCDDGNECTGTEFCVLGTCRRDRSAGCVDPIPGDCVEMVCDVSDPTEPRCAARPTLACFDG